MPDRPNSESPDFRLLNRRIEHAAVAHLSPLGWDHINLTGDYVWSDSVERDPDGFLPLRLNAEPGYRESVPQ